MKAAGLDDLVDADVNGGTVACHFK